MKTIIHNGSVFLVKYQEFSYSGGNNDSDYIFDNWDDALYYMKKEIETTIKNLKDIDGKDYECEWFNEHKGDIKTQGFGRFITACINAEEDNDGLRYDFKLIELPLRINDDYDNPDEDVEFVDMNNGTFKG